MGAIDRGGGGGARQESDLFLMGLLSLIDAMLETPMETVLEKIPLDALTKSVLLGQASVLRPVFQLMLAQESGEWEAAAALSEGLRLDADNVAACYWHDLLCKNTGFGGLAHMSADE